MFYYFPDNYIWSFQLQRALGESHFDGGNFNECLTVAEKLKNSNDNTDWYNEWYKMADIVFDSGVKALSEDNNYAAMSAFFRASNYFRLSEFFLKGEDPIKLKTYKRSIESFSRAIDIKNHFTQENKQIRTIKIPYENNFMFGYFVPSQSEIKMDKTLLFFGGLDSTAEELYFTAGKAFSNAGFDCFIVDGPGQGATLRLNKIPAIAEYEKPVSAALDFIGGYEYTNSKDVILLAMSMGGYYAPRAAAFEKRLKGCVVWGAQFDYGKLWQDRSDDHPLADQVSWVVGAKDIKNAKETLKNFTLKNIAHLIECPTFILHGGEDKQTSPKVARELYSNIQAKKRLKILSKEEGGSSHCQYDNLHLAHENIISWIQNETQ